MDTTRDLARIALFSALIAALGLVPAIHLPFLAGVPVTAQTLGVMLAGVLLGPVRGALACLLFILVVALGAPFLAGGRGGLGVFAGPTVGFLLGWPVAAFLAGLLMRRLSRLPVGIAAFLASTGGGILALYAIGVPVVSLMTGIPLATALAGSAAFVPGDLLKAALTGLVAVSLARARPSLIARGG